MLYYPEMGEKPAPRMFATRYVRSCYSVTWAESRDAEARAMLRALNMRKRSNWAVDMFFYVLLKGGNFVWPKFTNLGMEHVNQS